MGNESPGQYAQRMRELELTVRELLAAAQRKRKVKLDAGRVDTLFKVGDQVLLQTKELLDAADIGKLQRRWDVRTRRLVPHAPRGRCRERQARMSPPGAGR